MPSPVAQVTARLQRRLPTRLARIALLATFGLVTVGAGMLWATYRALAPELRGFLEQVDSVSPVGGTLVFAGSGDTLTSFYRQKRVNVDLEDVPHDVQQAVLSVEDWRFYEHWGIDLWGLARAVVANLRHGWGSQGASTLTQQLARNLILKSHERTLTRKLKEAMLTLRLERTYTKAEILRMYLNEIYFGEGAYGIEAAARTYFSRSVRDLNRIESVTLAGIPKNPNNYSPTRNPERALRRRNLVLRTMVDHGVLGQAAFDSLSALPLLLRPAAGGDQLGAYFVEEVRKHLESAYGDSLLYEGELRVYTQLDVALQASMEKALETRLHEIETTYDLPFERDPADSLAAGEPPRYLQGAGIALDPRTGAILAMVGGRSFHDSRFNRATQARRQPGSCFKPFVYTAAIQAHHTPADIILDTPVVIDIGYGLGLWKPQNYEKTFNGPVSMRYALAKSLNIPAIKLQEDVGTEKVIAVAKRLGIQSKMEAVKSLALGTCEVTLIELASAYGTLANGGIQSRPWFIERIEDRSGRILEQNQPFHAEALDPQTAYIVTHMLQSVIDWGTGHNARDLYGLTIPVAGKTGTTDDTADGWFVGYTPELVVGIWGGYDERKSIGLTGSAVGLPPWSDIMRNYYVRRPAPAFAAPAGIVSESVCSESGKLATPQCPKVLTEYFLSAARPQQECDMHTLRVMDLERSGSFPGHEDTRPPDEP